MKLPEYISLKEKEDFFEVINIDAPEQFEEVFMEYSSLSNHNFIFRGVNNASFKLLNSAQREWISKDLDRNDYTYFQYIVNIIKSTKNEQDGVIYKYLSAFNEKVTDLSVLSYIQHFGAPSPFLDFTYSFEKALFFAMHKANDLDISKKNELHDYVSLYIINLENNAIVKSVLNTDNFSKNRKIDNNYSPFRTFEDIIKKEYLKISETPKGNLAKMFDYNILLIPGYIKGGYQTNFPEPLDGSSHWNHQNLRVINQEGLFVFNSSQDSSLEEVYKSAMHSDYPIICLNIHKSLFHLRERELKNETLIPIDEKYIYPNEEEIVEGAYMNILKEYGNNSFDLLNDFREYKKQHFKLYNMAENMLKKNIQFEIFRFKISDLDKIKLDQFNNLKNVIYYFVFSTHNQELIGKVINSLQMSKDRRIIKFPKINNNSTFGNYRNLYVGKSEKPFIERLKQHFSGAGAKIWSLHLGAWKEIIKEDIELELYYYSFGDLKPEEKPLLEYIESSLHYKLKPILGRKGH